LAICVLIVSCSSCSVLCKSINQFLECQNENIVYLAKKSQECRLSVPIVELAAYRTWRLVEEVHPIGILSQVTDGVCYHQGSHVFGQQLCTHKAMY
jgi:hypothetical protein